MARGDTEFGLLQTPDGGLVHWDSPAQLLRHANGAGTPRNVAMFGDGRHAHLIVFDPTTGSVIGNLAAGPGGLPVVAAPDRAPMWRTRLQGRRILLLCDEGCLSWTADGGLRLAGSQAGEGFVLVSSRTRQRLDTMAAQDWIQASGAPVSRVADASGAPALRLGGELVGLDGLPSPLVAYGDDGEALRQLVVAGPKGRLHRLALFRPVICFAVFGADAYYEALGLALVALHRFGGYRGTICIGADRPREAVQPYVPDAFGESWMHVAVPAAEGLFGRYGLADWGLEAFQPVLYLDVDVVANAPLRRLLIQLAFSPKIHLATERDLERDFAGKVWPDLADSHDAAWFGGWLFAADPRFRARSPAFGSSGVIGADTTDRLRAPFALVGSLREIVDPARIAAYTDQALANYALHVCEAGFVLLNSYVDFARFADTAGPQRRGFMHFHSGVGTGALKRDAMRRYMDGLEADTKEVQPGVDIHR